MLKTAPKRGFLDTKLAIKRASLLKAARNVNVAMHLCSPVVLCYLDGWFEAPCCQKDFLLTRCLLLAAAACCLLKRVARPWTLKGGVNPRRGKPGSVIKTRTRTELGPSLA